MIRFSLPLSPEQIGQLDAAQARDAQWRDAAWASEHVAPNFNTQASNIYRDAGFNVTVKGAWSVVWDGQAGTALLTFVPNK